MPVWKRYFKVLFCPILASILLFHPAYASTSVFEQFFDKHAVVMLLIDPETGRIHSANEAASGYYGFSKAKLAGMEIQQINALSPEAVAAERKLAQKENRNYFIFRHRLADGTIRTVEVSSVPVTLNEKKLLFSIITDINELRATKDNLWHYQNSLEEMTQQQMSRLKAKELFIYSLLVITFLSLSSAALALGFLLYRRRKSAIKLQVEKQRLDDIIWGTNAGTWEWDITTGRVYINERWAQALGYSKAELGPLTITDWGQMTHPDDAKAAQYQLQKNLRAQQDHYECELRMRHKAGHWVWLLVRGKIVSWESEGRALRMSGTHQDISQQKAAALQLEHMAHFDQLTGIANRVLFYDRFDHALATAKRHPTKLAAMFIDLDGFKQINDDYGHHAGDELLRQVAERLKTSTRQSDTCARMGGDEFAVLLYHLDDANAAHIVAEHILSALSQPYILDNSLTLSITCSIGIALYPEHGDTSNHLVQRADSAMYSAKQSGKNCAALYDAESDNKKDYS